MRKSIVISCGPIPARLDSVKFITNRFKGGLAFKTADMLINRYIVNTNDGRITIVKWVHTELPDNIKQYIENYPDSIFVVDVKDVFEYYNWYDTNAIKHDAFIMAAAVANLTPSNPYDGKFPSHNYKVGEKFNIEFEIAPRAIDVVKQKNPRATLIGYKLFDAQTDDELIEIARHTLSDAKANIVFANTPKTAKNKKIAVFSDGSTINCNFDEHVDLIVRMIDAEFFKTNIIEIDKETAEFVKPYMEMVEQIEETFNEFGTVAFKVCGGFVTTARGHRGGAVFVKDINYATKTIYATAKATLNAPLLHLALYRSDADYVMHRHEMLDAVTLPYAFPGTTEETEMIKNYLDTHSGGDIIFNIAHHGYIHGRKYKEVDWNEYYKLFPDKYFKIQSEFNELIAKYDKDNILDIGGNIHPAGNYLLDTGVIVDGVHNITYDYLRNNERKFDLVVIKNAINYLTKEELILAKNSIKDGGHFLANTFITTPNVKVCKGEVAFSTGFGNEKIVHHFLMNGDDIYYHTFYGRERDFYEKLGFKVTTYGRNSAFISI